MCKYRPFGTDAIDLDDTASIETMGAVFRPQAYFRASNLVINKSTEITFDGSFSYHPYGKQITSYDWQFGDGTKAQGPKVTRTYRPAGPYRREIVKVTVTDGSGLTDTWIEYVEITDGLMPARKVDATRLKPGMVAEAWRSGSLSDLSFADRPADHYRGVVNWYVLNGKDHGEKCVKCYSGWFEVGESGEHEIRGAGSSGGCILLLDGVPVIDTTKTVDYGWGYEPYLQQRSRVFLEKGWHRFEFYHSKRQHTLSWNGPGVTYRNQLHDIAPVYHLQEEAGDAKVRYWLIGAPTSNGRPLVTRDGHAPDRSREPRVLVGD